MKWTLDICAINLQTAGDPRTQKIKSISLYWCIDYHAALKEEKKIPGGLGIKNISKRHFEAAIKSWIFSFCKKQNEKNGNTLKKKRIHLFIWSYRVTESMYQLMFGFTVLDVDCSMKVIVLLI